MRQLPIKILFVITHLELGGAQRQLFSILKRLNSSRYLLHLCAGDSGYLKNEFLKIPNLKIKFLPSLIREINPFLDFIAFLNLYRYIKRNKFDIVHTHSPKASILGRWAAYSAGVKNIIYTVHGWPFHRFINPLLGRFYYYLERLSAKITKKIIVVSKKDLEIGIIERIANPDKFVLIHYGLDLKHWENIYLKRKNTQPSKDLIINVSSLKYQKGLFDFLQIVKEILRTKSNLKFYLIGDGPLRENIKRKIFQEGLKNNVFLRGWAKDLTSIFSQAGMLVLTSLWEGLPLVVIEAVISGIPVVVTDTGGIKDIVRNNQNGIIIRIGDLDGFKRAIIDIIDNYQDWQESIERYRKGFNLFYWSGKRMVKDLERIYEELFNEG